MEEYVRTGASSESVTLDLGGTVLLTGHNRAGMRVLCGLHDSSDLLCFIHGILVEVGLHLPDQDHDQSTREHEQQEEQERHRDFAFDRVVAESADPAPERDPECILVSEEVKSTGKYVFSSRHDIRAEDSCDDRVNDDDIGRKAGCSALRLTHNRVECDLHEGSEDQYEAIGNDQGRRAPDAESRVIDKIRELEEHVDRQDKRHRESSNQAEHHDRLGFHRAREKHRHVGRLEDLTRTVRARDIHRKTQEEDHADNEVDQFRCRLAALLKEARRLILLSSRFGSVGRISDLLAVLNSNADFFFLIFIRIREKDADAKADQASEDQAREHDRDPRLQHLLDRVNEGVKSVIEKQSHYLSAPFASAPEVSASKALSPDPFSALPSEASPSAGAFTEEGEIPSVTRKN